jgi:hypothetical protein
MGAWVPGNSAMILPEGFAFLAEAGGYFLVEVHYPEGTEGMTDNTTVNFQFSSDPTPREVFMDPIINHFPPILEDPFLFIPANDTATFYASYNLPVDVTLISTMPHMHLIGQSMYCWGETPTNENIPLVGIDHWDFHWQYSYSYPSLVHLPDNTDIRAYAFYDNTANNPHQPNDPPQNVFGGEATDDEMLVVFFVYTPYQNGDEDIVVDPNTQIEEGQPIDFSIGLYPNPSSSAVNLNVFAKSHGPLSGTIIDSKGKTVKQFTYPLHAGGNTFNLNLSDLNSGLYFIKCEQGGHASVCRLNLIK